MISKEALQFLQDQFVAACRPTPFVEKTPFLVLPDGVSMQSMEKFLEHPVRFRGTFKTRRISDFVGYMRSHNEAASSTALFVDPDTIQAIAMLDLGDSELPGWGEHRAELKLAETPAYAALVNRSTTEMKTHELSQLQFIDFIADWAGHLEFFTGAEIHQNSAVIAAVRSISVQAKASTDNVVRNYGAERSTMEAIDISAKDGQKLPEGFMFTCKPYDEFRARTFNCQLRAVTDSTKGTAKLFYRITALDAFKLEIADEFLERINSRLTDERLTDLANSARIGMFAKG